MPTAQCLSIIIILVSSCVEIQSARAENITLNKCCPSDTYVTVGKKCTNYSDNLNFSEIKLYYDYREYNGSMSLTGRSLKDINYDLDYGIFDNDDYFKNESLDFSVINMIMYLTETGTLYLEAPNNEIRWMEAKSTNFCMDYLIDENKSNTTQNHPTVHYWITLPESLEKNPHSLLHISIGLLTSCVFLALVLVVYSLLPELRNLGGLVLMAYVASLFSAFFFMAVFQLIGLQPLGCQLLTYFCYYSFLASFCWMNVMSYDLWWTFRDPVKQLNNFVDWYRFKVYCAYAFGIPFAMTVFFVTVNHVPMDRFPGFTTPNVGQNCFLTGLPQLLYLYTPMMIMILMNWLFFMMTTYEIWSAHRQTAILDTAEAGTPAVHRQQLTRFLLYFKLSIVMGISWALEVISFFFPNLQYYWIVTDVYNFLIGLSIFFIFVCKRKILRKLKRRYHAWRNPDSGPIGNRSRSSHNTSSDASQEISLQMCPHPDAFNNRNQLKF